MSREAGVKLVTFGDGEYSPSFTRGLVASTAYLGGGCFAAFIASHMPKVVTDAGFPLGGSIVQLEAVYGAALHYTTGRRGGMNASNGWYVTNPGGVLLFQSRSGAGIIDTINSEGTVNFPLGC